MNTIRYKLRKQIEFKDLSGYHLQILIPNKTLAKLYKSLDRPHIEYCIAVTSLDKHINLMEVVEKGSTKLIPNHNFKSDYED